jgi:hypothetical protein
MQVSKKGSKPSKGRRSTAPGAWRRTGAPGILASDSSGGESDMGPTLQELGIDRLSIEERLALAQQLWEKCRDRPGTTTTARGPAGRTGTAGGRSRRQSGRGRAMGGGPG